MPRTCSSCSAERAGRALLATLALGACSAAPPVTPAALLEELGAALADYRSSAAGTARPPPEPPLAPLRGVTRARLASTLGLPDGCPGAAGAGACAHAPAWRYRYFAPPPLRTENGAVVVGYALTVDLELAFGADDTVREAHWRLGH